MKQTMQVMTASGYLATVELPLNPSNLQGSSFDMPRNIWSGYSPLQEPSVKACIKAVAALHGLETSDMQTKTRDHRISHPRQMAYMLAREVTGKSYPQIAAEFSCDHSTVMDGIRTCARRLEASKEAMSEYLVLRQRFVTEPVAKIPPQQAVKEKPQATTRKCSCGTTFETTEDYRFCDTCRARIERNSGGF